MGNLFGNLNGHIQLGLLVEAPRCGVPMTWLSEKEDYLSEFFFKNIQGCPCYFAADYGFVESFFIYQPARHS